MLQTQLLRLRERYKETTCMRGRVGKGLQSLTSRESDRNAAKSRVRKISLAISLSNFSPISPFYLKTSPLGRKISSFIVTTLWQIKITVLINLSEDKIIQQNGDEMTTNNKIYIKELTLEGRIKTISHQEYNSFPYNSLSR